MSHVGALRRAAKRVIGERGARITASESQAHAADALGRASEPAGIQQLARAQLGAHHVAVHQAELPSSGVAVIAMFAGRRFSHVLVPRSYVLLEQCLEQDR